MQINLMTILADDYNSFSKEIINVIAQQILKVVLASFCALIIVWAFNLKLSSVGSFAFCLPDKCAPSCRRPANWSSELVCQYCVSVLESPPLLNLYSTVFRSVAYYLLH